MSAEKVPWMSVDLSNLFPIVDLSKSYFLVL